MKYRIAALITLGAVFVLLILAGLYIKEKYTIKTVYVEGSNHYSHDRIKDLVMQGPLGDNSLYLSFKYRNKGVDDVPFVQKMDVNIVSPDTIRIMVYEKALAGYIDYLGKYMYFDADGIIVEASDQKTLGIPMVTGLSFDHVIMHEKLQVTSPEVFEDILDITQLLNKYNIKADRIAFDKSLHKTLYFGEARVSLGSNVNIGEKILKLSSILPELEGRSGVLRMDNYSQEVRNITFEVDKNGNDSTDSVEETESVSETESVTVDKKR